MNSVVLDECQKYLLEAQTAIDAMVDLNPYEELFIERGNIDNGKNKNNKPMNQKTNKFSRNKNGKNSNEIVANNDSLATKAINGIKNAIKVVKEVISAAISCVGEIFQRIGMSDEENEAYLKFKEAAAKDPSLKNKKVTVSDFRAIQKSYQDMITETEAQIREVERNGDVNIEPFSAKVNKFFKTKVSTVTTAVTADLAMNMAKGNRAAAKAINKSLKLQDKYMGGVFTEKLNKNIGEANTKKFKHDIRKLGKVISLQRIKAKLLHEESKSLREASIMTMDNLIHAIVPVSIATDKDAATGEKSVNIGKSIKKTAAGKLHARGMKSYLNGNVSKEEKDKKREIQGKIISGVGSAAADVLQFGALPAGQGFVKGLYTSKRDNRRVAKGKAPKGLRIGGDRNKSISEFIRG